MPIRQWQLGFVHTCRVSCPCRSLGQQGTSSPACIGRFRYRTSLLVGNLCSHTCRVTRRRPCLQAAACSGYIHRPYRARWRTPSRRDSTTSRPMCWEPPARFSPIGLAAASLPGIRPSSCGSSAVATGASQPACGLSSTSLARLCPIASMPCVPLDPCGRGVGRVRAARWDVKKRELGIRVLNAFAGEQVLYDLAAVVWHWVPRSCKGHDASCSAASPRK